MRYNCSMHKPITLFEDKKLYELYALHHGKEVIYHDGVPVGLLTNGRGSKAEFGWFGTWNREFAKPEFADFVRSFVPKVDRVFFTDYHNIFQDGHKLVCDEEEMVHTYIDINGRSMEDCFKKFEREKRRGIRKLLNSELDISYFIEDGSVDVFLKIHEEHLDNKQYQAPFSQGFFEVMLPEQFPNFQNELHFCREGETPIATLLTMCDSNWFYLLTAGLDERAYKLKMGDFMYYKALEYAIGKGCSYYSLGLTPKANTRLLAYKRWFGTECYDYSFFTFYKNNLVKTYYQQGKKFKRLLKS